jgi:hypothetical protein
MTGRKKLQERLAMAEKPDYWQLWVKTRDDAARFDRLLWILDDVHELLENTFEAQVADHPNLPRWVAATRDMAGCLEETAGNLERYAAEAALHSTVGQPAANATGSDDV